MVHDENFRSLLPHSSRRPCPREIKQHTSQSRNFQSGSTPRGSHSRCEGALRSLSYRDKVAALLAMFSRACKLDVRPMGRPEEDPGPRVASNGTSRPRVRVPKLRARRRGGVPTPNDAETARRTSANHREDVPPPTSAPPARRHAIAPAHELALESSLV